MLLGQSNEIINVGGEKVYHSEAEGVMQGIDSVVDVAILGEPNPITGMIVSASGPLI